MGVGAVWETAGGAAAEAGKGGVAMVLSAAASTVVEVLTAVVGGAIVGGVTTEEEGAGAGAVVAKAAAAIAAAAAAAAVVVSAAASSAAGPGATKALEDSTIGSAAGCFSGGGVGSTVCVGAFISSKGPARRLLKDTGKAAAAELGWGADKVGLGFGSGGLNRLPVDAPLDRSEPAETSGAIWRIEPKLNCATPLPAPKPGSTKENEAAAGLDEASFASSPWPTRSPEKLPRVSPPPAFMGCGSTLKAAAEDGSLSAEALEGTVEDALLTAAAAATVSPDVWPKTILPFPKENLFMSFPAGAQRKKKIKQNEEVCRGFTPYNTTEFYLVIPASLR